MSSSERIASLLPGLTDHVTQLGLSEYIVAHTHECVVMTSARCVSVTHPKLMMDESAPLSPAELSAGWATTRTMECLSAVHLSTHMCSYYRVDLALLKSAKPTILLTTLRKPGGFFRDAYGLDELKAAIMRAVPTIKVIHDIDPGTISEIYAASLLISRSFMVAGYAGVSTTDAVANSRKQLARIARSSSGLRHTPLRVAVVQWDDPIYLAGGWIPEAISIAGGVPCMEAVPGGASATVDVRELISGADVVIFAICAVDLAGCTMRAKQFSEMHAAVLANSNAAARIVAVDASVNFSRPTLSALVDTTQLIADIINRTGTAEWVDVSEINRNGNTLSSKKTHFRRQLARSRT